MALRALQLGAKSVTIYSRDEWKQQQMREDLPDFAKKESSRLRFILGCVRNKERLEEAIGQGDTVIHAAALKQVPAAELNPSEFIETNILGTQNVLAAAKRCGARAFLGLSTDKSVQPLNLYGATKLCAEKLITAAACSENSMPCSILRYGNVMGSRGSVLPIWLDRLQSGYRTLPVTSLTMTRFWISLDQAVEAAIWALQQQQGGEIFVPKLPSTSLEKLTQALQKILVRNHYPSMEIEEVGIRPGEKIHETLIGSEESGIAFETPKYYILFPSHLLESAELEEKASYWSQQAVRLNSNLQYSSDQAESMSSFDLQKAIEGAAPFLNK